MKKVLERFASSSDAIKIQIIDRLADSSDPRARSVLDEIDTMPLEGSVRKHLEKKLIAIEQQRPPVPTTVKKVVRLLSATDPSSRIQGISQARKSGTADVIPVLAKHMTAEVNTHVASFLVTTIGALGGVRTLSLILRYLKSEDIRVQGNAVETIGEIIRRDISPGLSNFLDSPNNRVRANAALALYSPYQERVRDVLIEMSSHYETNMRASSAWAMGHVREIWAVEALERLAEDKQALVRKNAMNSLSKLESFRASSALLRARTRVFGDANLFAGIDEAPPEKDNPADPPASSMGDAISSMDTYARKFAEGNVDLESIGRDVVKDAQLRLLDLSGDEYGNIRALLRDIAQLNRRKRETESKNISSLWGKIRTKEDPALSFVEREIAKKLREIGSEMRRLFAHG